MKRLLLLLIFIALPKIFIGQSCSYSGGGCIAALEEPTNLPKRAVGEICRVLGIRYIPVYQSNVENACATRYGGTPIITYGPDFMNRLHNGNSWAPVSVLAHEVGHHINEDISWYGQFKHPWTKELRADFVSGYALRKLGASLSNAQSAFRVMFNLFGSASHPDTLRRMAALEQGWLRANQGF